MKTQQNVKERSFKLMIKLGLSDSKKGHVISNKEMQRRMNSWQQ